MAMCPSYRFRSAITTGKSSKGGQYSPTSSDCYESVVMPAYSIQVGAQAGFLETSGPANPVGRMQSDPRLSDYHELGPGPGGCKHGIGKSGRSRSPGHPVK